MAVGDWLGQRARLSPHAIALLDGLHDCRPISYADWERAANRTAHLLARLGVAKGQRVALLALNCVEYLEIWCACAKLGAVLQCLNWRLTPAELGALLADAEPTLLVYGPQNLAQVQALRTFAALPPCLALDASAVLAGDQALAMREACPATPPPDPGLSLDDPWVICYTGGSTGLPKGAVLSHANIAANAVNTVLGWDLRASDLTLLNAPLFHTGGLNVLTAPLLFCGGASIICRSFDPEQVFDLLAHYPVSVLFGVPTMFIALQQHARWPDADLSRLRFVISGGAPCPLPVFERFWQRNVDFKTGYGLTEAGPNTFWLPPDEVHAKPGAVGRPLMHVEPKIIDAQGAECGDDAVGELLIRGPHVCKGYWQRLAETAQAFQDGWLHTGDLARRDAEGCYWIVGRIKDVIISGGENIYPAEVESVLAAHPAVAEAALIGVPDAHWGEVGRALLVLRPGQQFDPDALRAYCQQRLARYKVPRSFLPLEALPRTAAGKIDKQALRDAYAEV